MMLFIVMNFILYNYQSCLTQYLSATYKTSDTHRILVIKVTIQNLNCLSYGCYTTWFSFQYQSLNVENSAVEIKQPGSRCVCNISLSLPQPEIVFCISWKMKFFNVTFVARVRYTIKLCRVYIVFIKIYRLNSNRKFLVWYCRSVSNTL